MAVAEALQETRVSHLDLSEYVCVPLGTSVRDALLRLRQQRSGAALVTDADERLQGIFTERDVMLKVADDPGAADAIVDTLMTAPPQTLSDSATVGEALQMMNVGGYRNVPVVDDDGMVVGNLSQPSVIRFLTDRFPREIYNLPPDPEIIARTREGA
ncbi:MAG: CBS domain-containing protein [Candidatus Latescibacterota bacterium]|nr:CBS domain-containing protein [Candidatus Latescibacterota bacterium]